MHDSIQQKPDVVRKKRTTCLPISEGHRILGRLAPYLVRPQPNLAGEVYKAGWGH